MNILAIISGEYGRRHVATMRMHGPEAWAIESWQAPTVFPLVIDHPEDFLPDSLPKADLLLSFSEHKAVAELLPEIAQVTSARAVIAAIDNEAWLPRGLARQLRGWLLEIGVTCVTPKPLCSLTESTYSLGRGENIPYTNPLIAEYARHFGRPGFDITVDPENETILSIKVRRDAVCGCARFVAQELVGHPISEAVDRAGLLHHHYPCLASMGIDSDYSDTLLHVSGNLLKDEVRAQLKPFQETHYITPGTRVPTTDQGSEYQENDTPSDQVDNHMDDTS